MDYQMWFETFRFCSKVSSKCRKCHFREPNFKYFLGGMPPNPVEICRDFGLTFFGRQISVGLPSWTEASTSLGTRAVLFVVHVPLFCGTRTVILWYTTTGTVLLWYTYRYSVRLLGSQRTMYMQFLCQRYLCSVISYLIKTTRQQAILLCL